MVKHTFKPNHCDLCLLHKEGDNNMQQEHKEESDDSEEIMSAFDATDHEIDYLNDLDNTYNDQIIKKHEFDDDDDDWIADKVANSKGDSDIEVEYLEYDIESDPDDVDDDIEHDKDTDDVNSTDIDIDIDNIDKLLNKKYINQSLLNRISLDDVILIVKDAKPIINHKDNANQNTRERKSITNNNKQKIAAKQKDKIKISKEVKGTGKQNEDTLIQETNNNNGAGHENEKLIITRSKSRNLTHVTKINANISKSIETPEYSATELKLFTRTKLTYEEQMADVQNRKDTERYKRSPHKCDICFKGFWQLSSYNLHMDKHTNKVSGLSCQECDISFASKTAYQQHLKVSPKHAVLGQPKRKAARSTRHHPQRRQNNQIYEFCPLCEKAFSPPARLRQHMCLHTGERPYKCEKCGRAFILKGNYKLHIMRRHTDNPPRFPCEVCRKEFASGFNRARHMKLHTGPKPAYKCGICDKIVTTVEGLDRHITHVHHKVPWPKRGPRRHTQNHNTETQ